ncbi:MAG: glycosyltransferase family 2 protein [Sulfuritalea sp.]|nr:glycosyltransferase family 2 protein [Sulfuritalea sp.]
MTTEAASTDGAATVSVIVVNFNAQRTLSRCLAALRAQSLQAARVIVIDNASTDGSIESARELFPEFEYVSLPVNTGFAAANNRAIALCDSEFVALLNPDAFAEPAWLEELVKAARRTPAAASFGSCQLMAGEADLIDGIEDVCHISGLVWRGDHGRSRNSDDCTAREIFSPCAAAALYRRQAIQSIGAFDEDFFCYVEDVDLGFRLRLVGWQSWYVPAAVVRHVGSATTGGAHSGFAVYHGHRNLVWMFVKNMPGYLFWLLLPLHIAMNLVSVAWFIFRGQAGAILSAKRDAILGLRRVWQKRAIVQSRRTLPTIAFRTMLNRNLIPGRRQSRTNSFT